MRLLLAVLLLLPLVARAGDQTADAGWLQRPGARLSSATKLRDEAGQPITLGSLFGKSPIILDLGYYKCPSLCGIVRNDLLSALSDSSLRPGHDFILVVLSIDPAETTADAAEAKRSDLARVAESDAADWHYLTGTATEIAAVERTVGFHARYDERFRQFVHPSGLIVLTGDGTVSGYLLGVGYQSSRLRAAIQRAAQGGISQSASPILLLCFHYDASSGRYSLSIEKILRLMGLLTVLTLSGVLLALHVTRPGRRPL